MTGAIAAEKITLYDLEQRFGLQVADNDFFYEWQEDLPPLSDVEEQRLGRVWQVVGDILPTLTLRVQCGLPNLAIRHSCPTPLI